MFGFYPCISDFNMQMFNPYTMTFPFAMQYPSNFSFLPSFGGNFWGDFSFTNNMFNSFNSIFSMNYNSIPLPQNTLWNSPNYNFTSSTNNYGTTSTQKQSTSKKAKLFDDNTKIHITKVKNGAMPYLLIGPENVDPNEKLPVLVYLHGIDQRGSNPDLLEKYEYDPAVIMKNWNLKNFRGYILCPQLPKNGSWCRKSTEQSVRKLLTEFESTHNVDKDKISLIGFSLGGAGALYLANEMSDVFKKAVTLSPYNPGNLSSKMKIPTKAFAGGNDDNRDGGPIKMTKGRLKNILGEENCKIIPGKSHGQLPPTVFKTDADKNGCSDIIEWLFS